MTTKKIITSFEMLNETHAQEIKDFHTAFFQKWEPIAEKEAELAALYGKVENSPINAQKEIAALREEFRQEWGSDGRLINNILQEQKRERLELSKSLQQVREERTRKEDRERS